MPSATMRIEPILYRPAVRNYGPIQIVVSICSPETRADEGSLSYQSMDLARKIDLTFSRLIIIGYVCEDLRVMSLSSGKWTLL